MSADGTPQGYLANFRQNTTASNYRDPSMEQNNTNSGNPQGYYNPGPQAPPNRYIPPSYNPATGQWEQQGLTYSLPTAYTPNGGGGMPTGPTPMPNLYGAPQGQPQGQPGGTMPQPQQAAPGGVPMPNFVNGSGGAGTPQPADIYMRGPRTDPPPNPNSMAQGQVPQFNVDSGYAHTDPQQQTGLSQAQTNAVNGNGIFPSFNNTVSGPTPGGVAQPAQPAGTPVTSAGEDYRPNIRQLGRHSHRVGYQMPNRYNPEIRNY